MPLASRQWQNPAWATVKALDIFSKYAVDLSVSDIAKMKAEYSCHRQWHGNTCKWKMVLSYFPLKYIASVWCAPFEIQWCKITIKLVAQVVRTQHSSIISASTCVPQACLTPPICSKRWSSLYSIFSISTFYICFHLVTTWYTRDCHMILGISPFCSLINISLQRSHSPAALPYSLRTRTGFCQSTAQELARIHKHFWLKCHLPFAPKI